MRYNLDNIAYKVCRYDYFNKEYISINSVTTGVSKLVYKIGQKTIPVCGKVFIFNNLKDARTYISDSLSYYAIFKGFAKNKKQLHIPVVLNRSGLIDKAAMCQFWTRVDAGDKFDSPARYNGYIPKPINTYVCDSFIPIKKVN